MLAAPLFGGRACIDGNNIMRRAHRLKGRHGKIGRAHKDYFAAHRHALKRLRLASLF